MSTRLELPAVDGVSFRFSKQHHRMRFAIENSLRVSVDPPGGEDWTEGLDRPSCVVKLVLEKSKWIQGQRWTRRVSDPVRSHAPCQQASSSRMALARPRPRPRRTPATP
ncbi:unnamed protein product [Prorocentrum cordatum]|uniref:Uncharacterized protein n=1 Tax=Prorocentrum cordatum TaxID=2364126 RepID=A0ABN9PLV4_9DINO|nr:unnamed protein product [Polarella glacialis]